MAGRGKTFELLDFPKFALPSLAQLDAAQTSLHLVDRLSGKTFMSYASIWSHMPAIVAGHATDAYIAKELQPYSEDWKNDSIGDVAKLLRRYFGGRGKWYPYQGKPFRVLGFWFKPSIKGIWFVDGQAYAVLVNARKTQRLTHQDVRFLARGIYELHCVDDPNDPIPLILDVSERRIDAGRTLEPRLMPVESAISLDEFDAMVREFLKALELAGVAVPSSMEADSVISLFKKR
jgi:hypothetical protein